MSEMMEKVARAIQTVDEQNGGAPYAYAIKHKHTREALFDRARAAIAEIVQRLRDLGYTQAGIDEVLK